MKTTYSDDLQELSRKFSFVDKQDPIALQRWFETYLYLSTNDHAQIADRSTSYIRRLKKLAGINGKMPANLPVPKSRSRVVNIIVPDDWDNPVWLQQMIRIYSSIEIAKAVGIDTSNICRKLQKYGITDRLGTKPRNKCCTRDWCIEHYVNQGLTQIKCAELAGIGQQTFSNWLNRFKIPVRTSRETQKSHTDVRLWVRELLHKLKQQPTVRKVFLRKDHIHVRFINYFWETYYVDHRPLKNGERPPLSYIITKKDASLIKVPQVRPEFETSLLNTDHSCHITINRQELNQASFMERRMAIHEYCRQFTQREWLWPEYPDNILRAEWDKMRDYKEVKYLKSDGFTSFAHHGNKPAPGRRIIEHFFDLSEFIEVFRSPRMTMKILNLLLKREDLAFNVHNFLRIFSCDSAVNIPAKYPKFRLSDPVVYAVIFERLGIRGTVFDVTPGFGNRAIACALKGLKYTTIPDERFKLALSKGFVEFTGLKYEEYNGQEIDLLLYDNNFSEADIPKILKYTDRAKHMMIFVPHSQKLKTQAKYKPESIIKIRTRWFQKAPDYLFLY